MSGDDHEVRPHYRSDGGKWVCYTCGKEVRPTEPEQPWVHKK